MSTRRLKLLLPVLVLAVGGLGAWALLATRPRVVVEQRVPRPPRVRVVEAAPRTVRLTVQSQGTVAPRTESDLVPQVSGTLVRVSPSLVSGGFFDEGEILLEIDPLDHASAVERARATRVRTESEYDHAVKELARLRRLHERNVASAARVDDAVNAERVAGAALREARAAVEQAERDLERTRLRAPYKGRVREESVGVGQYVSRGTPVARLYAIDYVEVRLPIPDAQLAYLDLPLRRPTPRVEAGPLAAEVAEAEPPQEPAQPTGPVVVLRARFAGAEHTWRGRIVRTEGEIDPRSRMVHVVAQVEAPYELAAGDDRPPLAVGLFVRAEIEGREVPGAIVLPRAAVHAEDGRERVWVVDAGDRLRERPVEVLRAGRDEVVIGGGLEPGTLVVVSPLEIAIEGMAVRPLLGPKASEARS